MVFYDAIRDRNIATEIYYPADDPGENEPVGEGRFPVLVFGHGFLMSWEAYENFWEELVPRGYVICFPTTEMGISADHRQFGEDIKYLAAQMQREAQDSLSLFFQSLAPETALMGHSMGGGAAFLAAENNSEMHTLITFAAAETNPSAISAAGNVHVPTLVFSGDDDCVTPAAQHQDILYDQIPPGCKTFISIINGGHCYFANNNFLCSLGELSCNPSLDITREAQQGVTFDFLNLWLQYTLYHDPTAFDIFTDSLQSSSRVNHIQACSTLSIREAADPGSLQIYPNPADSILQVALEVKDIGGVLVIYNGVGERVYDQVVHTSPAPINVSTWPDGTYIAVYEKESIRYSRTFVKFGQKR